MITMTTTVFAADDAKRASFVFVKDTLNGNVCIGLSNIKTLEKTYTVFFTEAEAIEIRDAINRTLRKLRSQKKRKTPVAPLTQSAGGSAL